MKGRFEVIVLIKGDYRRLKGWYDDHISGYLYTPSKSVVGLKYESGRVIQRNGQASVVINGIANHSIIPVHSQGVLQKGRRTELFDIGSTECHSGIGLVPISFSGDEGGIGRIGIIQYRFEAFTTVKNLYTQEQFHMRDQSGIIDKVKSAEFKTEAQFSPGIICHVVNGIPRQKNALVRLFKVWQGVVQRRAVNPTSPVVITECGENVLMHPSSLRKEGKSNQNQR